MKKQEIKLVMIDNHFKIGDIITTGNNSSFIIKKCPNDKSKFWRFINKITFGAYKTRNYYIIK